MYNKYVVSEPTAITNDTWTYSDAAKVLTPPWTHAYTALSPPT